MSAPPFSPELGEVKADPNKKDRKYALILYPDATNYNPADVLDRVCQFAEWSYILHDRDVDDDKIPVKPHIHVLLRLISPVPPGTISNKLLLPNDVLVYRVAKYKNYLKYMLHRTEDSNLKYQYSVSSLHTSIKGVEDIIVGSGETNDLRRIIDILDTNNHFTISRLTRYVLDHCPECWASYRRNYSIIKHLLFEATYVDDVWASLTERRISEGIVHINASELQNFLKSLRRDDYK